MKLTKADWKALEMAAEPKAVLWPSWRYPEPTVYGAGADGRVHIAYKGAPDLHIAGLINRHGVITPAGIAALAEHRT